MRSRPRQSARASINTGRQSSLYTHFSESQRDTCAHCSLAVLCASPGEGVAASSEVYCFYLSGLDSLISFGYFLLGALALLGYWFATRILLSVKVKVLGGWLRPMVG
jgi:hypothetical protein